MSFDVIYPTPISLSYLSYSNLSLSLPPQRDWGLVDPCYLSYSSGLRTHTATSVLLSSCIPDMASQRYCGSDVWMLGSPRQEGCLESQTRVTVSCQRSMWRLHFRHGCNECCHGLYVEHLLRTRFFEFLPFQKRRPTRLICRVHYGFICEPFDPDTRLGLGDAVRDYRCLCCDGFCRLRLLCTAGRGPYATISRASQVRGRKIDSSELS